MFVFAVVGACALTAAALAQNVSDALWLDMGVEALKQRQYDEAIDAFDKGRQAARAADDRRLEAVLTFYAGFTHHQQAEGGADREQRLHDAQLLYEQALKLEPQRGPILNNLASLYAVRGDSAKAERLYQQAIDLGDEQQGLYARNYAELLIKTRTWEAAAPAYRRILKVHLDDVLRWTLVVHYAKEKSSNLIEYLWSLVRNGQIEAAQQAALFALASGEFTLKDNIALVGVVAATLASQFYDPQEFVRTDAAKCLREIAEERAAARAAGWTEQACQKPLTLELMGDECPQLVERMKNLARIQHLEEIKWKLDRREMEPDRNLYRKLERELDTLLKSTPRVLPRLENVREAVDEIDRLHRGETFEPSSYRWWRKRAARQESGERPARVDSFGRLARSLGERLIATTDPKNWQKAEGYFLLAVDLHPDRPDPEALLRLTELYLETNRLSKVAEMAEKYEPKISKAMKSAYRGLDWQGLFKYRRALGVLYSREGEWGDETTIASAIFQIERAIEVAQRLGDAGGRPAAVSIETGLIDLLAQGYRQQEHADKSLEVRLDAAELYLDAGLPEKARTVVAQIQLSDDSPLSQRFGPRLDKVRRRTEQ